MFDLSTIFQRFFKKDETEKILEYIDMLEKEYGQGIGEPGYKFSDERNLYGRREDLNLWPQKSSKFKLRVKKPDIYETPSQDPWFWRGGRKPSQKSTFRI